MKDILSVNAVSVQHSVSHFMHQTLLSGYPHLEETYHVGEGVIPAVRRRGFAVTNHGPALAEKAQEKQDAEVKSA